MMSHKELVKWLADNDPRKISAAVIDLYELLFEFQKQNDATVKLMDALVNQMSGLAKLNDNTMKELRELKRFGDTPGVTVQSEAIEKG